MTSISPGDIVVITSIDGLENRYGWLGIVIGPAYKANDRWDILIAEPDTNGWVVTYHQDNIEVIDHMDDKIIFPEIPEGVVQIIGDTMDKDHLRALYIKEKTDQLTELINEMEQVIIDKLGDSTDVKPIRILYEMRREVKHLRRLIND